MIILINLKTELIVEHLHYKLEMNCLKTVMKLLIYIINLMNLN